VWPVRKIEGEFMDLLPSTSLEIPKLFNILVITDIQTNYTRHVRSRDWRWFKHGRSKGGFSLRERGEVTYFHIPK
jgi:hypothetical protein